MSEAAKLKFSKNKLCHYFGTDGIRGCVGKWPITPEFVLKLGWAVGKVFACSGSGKILIGKDTRISGYMFESVLESGLSAAGIDTHLLGPMPTPAIAYLTRTLRAQAGIVISASHNPYYDNGIKFFSDEGIKLPDHMEYEIEQHLVKPMTIVSSDKLGKAIRIVDAPGRYIEFCKSTVASDILLNGLKIIIDCAHGAAYQVAPSIFRELGAEVVEMGVEPNGLNINLNCGVLYPDALCNRLLAERADLGIILDGDGDRVLLVDHQGRILDGDDLLYIIVKDKKQRGLFKGEGVVGTTMSNMGFEHSVKALGLKFVRVPVGDRYIMSELIKRNWYWGGEPSGHIVCLEKNTTGDGIITALQVLAAMRYQDQTLADLSRHIGRVKYPQVLINVQIEHTDSIIDTPPIQKAIREAEQELGVEGRILLRYSGTEPVIRIMVEGKDSNHVQRIAQNLSDLIQNNQ